MHFLPRLISVKEFVLFLPRLIYVKESVSAFSAKTNLCTSSTYNLLNSCCQQTMDTSSSRSQQGSSGCWRRCKSASPTKRMWKIYISTFLNLVSCSRTSLNILILLSVYFFFFSFQVPLHSQCFFPTYRSWFSIFYQAWRETNRQLVSSTSLHLEHYRA